MALLGRSFQAIIFQNGIAGQGKQKWGIKMGSGLEF
jgi:hypothetical protein